jgi:hypothetical protein
MVFDMHLTTFFDISMLGGSTDVLKAREIGCTEDLVHALERNLSRISRSQNQ